MSGTIGVSQDQTVFAIEGNGQRDSHHGDGYCETDTMYTLNATEHHAVACHDVAETIDANYYKGCGERNGAGREVVAYSQDAYDKYEENEKSAALRAQGGVYGGGSEALVVSENDRKPLRE